MLIPGESEPAHTYRKFLRRLIEPVRAWRRVTRRCDENHATSPDEDHHLSSPHPQMVGKIVVKPSKPSS